MFLDAFDPRSVGVIREASLRSTKSCLVETFLAMSVLELVDVKSLNGNGWIAYRSFSVMCNFHHTRRVRVSGRAITPKDCKRRNGSQIYSSRFTVPLLSSLPA